jgi:uncharacterized protein YecE (DUF72 family)
MSLYVGTSGFAYREWKGKFYPRDIPPKEMLHYYSQRFNAVEINNTFYHMPNRPLLKGWSEQVPDGFLFAIKAPRVITHIKRLDKAEQETERLIDAASELGTKLGPILFQLPATFRCDLPRLEAFLAVLHDVPTVFEFRHPSWLNPETFSLLHGSNSALCISDREPDGTPDVESTTKWGYFRLRQAYSESDLALWRTRILRPEWANIYVFFKHEPEGAGPRMATSFMENR